MAEKKTILFSPPDITEEEIAEVADALRSGWITTGPRVKGLERQLAEYLGVNRCVCPVRKWPFACWGSVLAMR